MGLPGRSRFTLHYHRTVTSAVNWSAEMNLMT